MGGVSCRNNLATNPGKKTQQKKQSKSSQCKISNFKTPHLQCFEKYTDVSMVKCGGKIERWEIFGLGYSKI